MNRVNWLWAKARSDQWQEELLIVQNEIQWTILAFHSKAEEWAERMDDTKFSPGQLAYASKQKAMWEAMAVKAERAFDEDTSSNLQL